VESLNSLLQVCYGKWVSECYSVLTINLYILSVLSIMARLWAGWWENQGLIWREGRDFCLQTSSGHHPSGAVPSPPPYIFMVHKENFVYFFYVTLISTTWCHDPEDHDMSKLSLYIPSLYLKLFSSLCHNRIKMFFVGMHRAADMHWQYTSLYTENWKGGRSISSQSSESGCTYPVWGFQTLQRKVTQSWFPFYDSAVVSYVYGKWPVKFLVMA
jgi:hypothetical protein